MDEPTKAERKGEKKTKKTDVHMNLCNRQIFLMCLLTNVHTCYQMECILKHCAISACSSLKRSKMVENIPT